jgi:TfoX/Sxy family transcriptional regulator of competence genes
MAYDEDLAHRIRELLLDEDGVTEMKMFGGLAFLLGGHMSVAASRHGGLLVRLAPATAEQALASPHARPMVMRGREMKGWMFVDGDGVKTKRQLAVWVRRGVEYARSLPAKG